MNDRGKELAFVGNYLTNEIEKILNVDLINDTFEIIKIDDSDLDPEKGYDSRFSVWLTKFADSGMIFKEDIERFKQSTSLDIVRKYFQEGNKKLSIPYRRKKGEKYVWVNIKMIPAMDYSKDNEHVIIFVQEDDALIAFGDTLEQARKYLEIMNALGSMYIMMLVINLDNDVFADVTDRSKLTNLVIEDNASAKIKVAMKSTIADESLDEVLEFVDLATIRERMQDTNEIHKAVLSKKGLWYAVQFIKVAPSPDLPELIIATVKLIDDEMRKRNELNRLSAELNLATTIQRNAIPNIFPAFPTRTEFDLYASMTPAKEIGGDFYDFFAIDKDNFGLVIADVSGKGIPAALFMMVCKVLIKNQTFFTDSPADILRRVNHIICENNQAEMFVTVWLGIINVETGKMITSNAGHEWPAIRRADGKFEFIHDHHGLVIGGIDKMKYKEDEIQLNPGDTLFVYTDGVTEATNSKNELFGNDRLLAALNKWEPEASSEELLKSVRSSIDDFVQDAPQFDDLTMLAFHYYGPDTTGTSVSKDTLRYEEDQE